MSPFIVISILQGQRSCNTLVDKNTSHQSVAHETRAIATHLASTQKLIFLMYYVYGSTGTSIKHKTCPHSQFHFGPLV